MQKLSRKAPLKSLTPPKGNRYKSNKTNSVQKVQKIDNKKIHNSFFIQPKNTHLDSCYPNSTCITSTQNNLELHLDKFVVGQFLCE